MELSTLIVLLLILSVLLVLLLLSYRFFPDETASVTAAVKADQDRPGTLPKKQLSFEEISRILVQSSSSKEELGEAIEQLIRYHGKIHAKLGELVHPDFKRYEKLLIDLCKNRQADKELILSLDQKLGIKNPQYRLEIDEAVNKGLAGRGF